MASKQNIQPKYEMIVTRHKSAQLKRQLRNKDRSMTHITQLLMKSPPKSQGSTKSTLKKVKNDKIQRLRKVSENCNKEYHPNKLKRDLKRKKIVLKPKQDLKMIANVNKRKLGVPQKGLKDSSFKQLKHLQEFNPNKVRSKSQNGKPELSMADFIQITEDSQGLDDEDLMEILTCPSPVWWEDPPDIHYSEDPVFTKLYSISEDCDILKTFEKKSIQGNERDKIAVGKTKLPLKTIKDDKFMKKRNKLEHLLGNIRNKIGSKLDIDISNKELNIPSLIEDNDLSPNTESITKDERKVSESTEGDVTSDSGIRDYEMLKDLECMEIPIQQKEIKTDTSSQLPNDEAKDDNQIDIEDFLRKTFITVKKEFVDDLPSKKIPDMPPLKMRPIQKSSTLSHKSYRSDASNRSQDNLYSISDTNIRFLDDCDSNEVDRDFKINIIEKSENFNGKLFIDNNQVKRDDECITVYKIVSDERLRHVKKEMKLNNYFNKRKNANRNRKHKKEINMNATKKIKTSKLSPIVEPT